MFLCMLANNLLDFPLVGSFQRCNVFCCVFLHPEQSKTKVKCSKAATDRSSKMQQLLTWTQKTTKMLKAACLWYFTTKPCKTGPPLLLLLWREERVGNQQWWICISSNQRLFGYRKFSQSSLLVPLIKTVVRKHILFNCYAAIFFQVSILENNVLQSKYANFFYFDCEGRLGKV